MPHCDTLIRNVQIVDGSGAAPQLGSVAIEGKRIAAVGDVEGYTAEQTVDARGKALAPGFIDAHTHDDLYLIREPGMLPKLSQGVTTVIVGNCGISAAPVTLKGDPVDPMNLLGRADEFCYRRFADYIAAVRSANPALNVAALVGHTSLRNNQMERLDRAATSGEIAAMRSQLLDALDQGALGLSSGLAYASAHAASTAEVMALAECLSGTGAIYATHLRSEGDQILAALEEALTIGRHAQVPVVISHLKCAGMDNWHRSRDVLRRLEAAANNPAVAWDCYPYAASSTTLDLRQVDERVTITVTWSEPHPELAGQTLAHIAESWGTTQAEAAKRLQPAGAIYHCMSEDDVRVILGHPVTMIGSDGLPNDHWPHPRLWGTFPRVLGHYVREQKLFSLAEGIRKMTSHPAERFGLKNRGRVKEGYPADLVLFDAEQIADTATFANPVRMASGIEAVWVNGALSYKDRASTGLRAGIFLSRQSS